MDPSEIIRPRHACQVITLAAYPEFVFSSGGGFVRPGRTAHRTHTGLGTCPFPDTFQAYALLADSRADQALDIAVRSL